MKYKEKQQAIVLRKKGFSLCEIAEKLGVAKSSVSGWVRGVVLDSKIQKKLHKRSFSRDAIEKRRTSRLLGEKQKRIQIILGAEKEIKKITKKDLRIIGTALYWAEGGKRRAGSARVSNSDPYLILFMMRFFREICEVPEKKFRGQIHTHSHLNVRKSECYWSELTGIPVSQFYKTYAKPSKASLHKKDTLPYGTFDINVPDNKVFLRLMGWIRKIGSIPHLGEN